jgi:hypothetical protein
VTARWVLEPDLCDMPVGYGQLCNLPADHTDGCRWPEPPCLCSHPKHSGRCPFLSCGCSTYREQAIK